MALRLLWVRSKEYWQEGTGQLAIRELVPDWEVPDPRRLPAERKHGYLLAQPRAPTSIRWLLVGAAGHRPTWDPVRGYGYHERREEVNALSARVTNGGAAVPHYSRLNMIVIDVPEDDHDQELAFWQAAIGQELTWSKRHPEFHGALVPRQQQLGLIVQRLGEGQARVHLDFHTDDVEAEVTRLEKLGAKREQRVKDWYVMRDPAGMLFCVVAEKPGSLDDDNAHRWD